MSETEVADALAIIVAMKKSQPGPHVEILEKGFAALYEEAVAAKIDRKLVAQELKGFRREMFANIPLSPADPVWDPNDEFKRCAVDRAERTSKFTANLSARLDPTTLATPHMWSAILGVVVSDPDGWDRSDPESFNVPLTRAEFISRLGASTVRTLPGSVLS